MSVSPFLGERFLISKYSQGIEDGLINNTLSRQNNVPPKDIHILLPRTCDYVTLHVKGTLLRLLR